MPGSGSREVRRGVTALFGSSVPLDPSVLSLAIAKAKAQGLRGVESWPVWADEGPNVKASPGAALLERVGVGTPPYIALDPTQPSKRALLSPVVLVVFVGSVLALALLLLLVKAAEHRKMDLAWKKVQTIDISRDPDAARDAAEAFVALHRYDWARNPWADDAQQRATAASEYKERRVAAERAARQQAQAGTQVSSPKPPVEPVVAPVPVEEPARTRVIAEAERRRALESSIGRATLENWLRAQNTDDFSSYKATYCKRMRGKKNALGRVFVFRSRRAWLRDRKPMFGHGAMVVAAEDLRFAWRSRERLALRFTQYWISGSRSYADCGTKILELDMNRGGCITYEEMLSSKRWDKRDGHRCD